MLGQQSAAMRPVRKACFPQLPGQPCRCIGGVAQGDTG